MADSQCLDDCVDVPVALGQYVDSMEQGPLLEPFPGLNGQLGLLLEPGVPDVQPQRLLVRLEPFTLSLESPSPLYLIVQATDCGAA